MKTVHDPLMEDPEFRKQSAIENLAGDASDLIARLMHEQKISKADLARRLGKSRAWVTQLLNGRANMTVRTLAEVVFYLDGEVKIHAEPANSLVGNKAEGKIFKMEVPKGYPRTADVFRIPDNRLLNAEDPEPSDNNGGRSPNEYAA